MSFAALGQVRPSLGLDKRDALVIITVDSDLGMVAIHDRRPVVLSLEHAREWLDPDLSKERAIQVPIDRCRPTQDF